MDESRPQKIKIVGALWTFRQILGVTKDILGIILLILAIGAVVMLYLAMPKITETLGGLGQMANQLGIMTSGGPEALIADLQKEVNSGNWGAASDKLSGVEILVKQMNPPKSLKAEMESKIDQLKQAIEKKDKTQFNQLLNQFLQQSNTEEKALNPGER